MKRFFTLAALLISIVSFAETPSRAGRIIISNNDNSFITVQLNGRSYNVNQQTMILNNLAGGKHMLQVFRTENRPYTFARPKPVLIFRQPVYVDPSYIVDLFISRFGQVSMSKSLTIRNGNSRYDDRFDNRYDDRLDKRDENRYDDRYDYNRNGQSNDRNNQYDNRNGGQYENRGGDNRGNDNRGNDNRGNDNRSGNQPGARNNANPSYNTNTPQTGSAAGVGNPNSNPNQNPGSSQNPGSASNSGNQPGNGGRPARNN